MATEAAQQGRMRILLEHVAKALVDDPAAVVVTESQDGDFTKLHLQVAEADVGKVIGRGGRIAKAIRALGVRDDLLVPALSSVVRSVDVAAGRIVIVPQEPAE